MSAKDWISRVPKELAEDRSVSLEARMTFIVLMGYEGKDGAPAFPGLEVLAWILGRHRTKVQRYIRELEGAGWLTRKRFKGKAGRFQSVRYVLLRNHSHDSCLRSRVHHSHDSPQSRKPITANPTTVNVTTNNSQSKQFPVLTDTKEQQQQKAKQRDNSLIKGQQSANGVDDVDYWGEGTEEGRKLLLGVSDLTKSEANHKHFLSDWGQRVKDNPSAVRKALEETRRMKRERRIKRTIGGTLDYNYQLTINGKLFDKPCKLPAPSYPKLPPPNDLSDEEFARHLAIVREAAENFRAEQGLNTA